jgi:hypothetical protein
LINFSSRSTAVQVPEKDCRSIFKAVIDSCPHLKQIDIDSNTWSLNNSTFNLLTSSNLMAKLTHLNIPTSIEVEPSNLGSLVKGTNLRYLNLSNQGGYIRNLDIERIAQGCSRLEHFDVPEKKLNREGLTGLVNARGDTLRTLDVCLTENSHLILPVLAQCEKLEHLTLRSGALRYVGFQHLAKLKKLKSLSINAVYIMPNNFVKHFSGGSFQSLTSLSLTSHTLTDECLEAVGNTCHNLRQLTIEEEKCYSR